MSDFFDAFNDFIDSLFEKRRVNSGRHDTRFADPYMQEAWNELDDYLNKDASREKNRPSFKKSPYQDGGTIKNIEQEKLREDYKNLEVPFGSPLETVKKSYKKILMKYHPDKHSDDPEKLRIATEITKKVNASFLKIRAFENQYP